MTRRSTRRVLCMPGQMSTSPGPLMPVKRPRVNTTTRSYSFSTLMALKTSTMRNMAIAITNDMSVSSRERRSTRLDPQCQTFHPDDTRQVAGVQRGVAACVPQLPAVAHASPAAEVRDHFGRFADHALRSGGDRTAHGAAREVHDARDHEPAHGGERTDQRPAHIHARHVRIEKKERADDECNQPPYPERAVGREEKLRDDHGGAEHHQR